MTKITIIKRSLFLLSVCLLTACGAPQELVQLEDAREFYNAVSHDPTISRNAALELVDAKKYLQKAQKHWEDGANKNIVEHFAYMTDQQLAIAQYRAKLIENEGQLSSLILEHQMSELQAQRTDRGLVLTLGHELFEENNASLLPEAVVKIGKVAGFMNEYPEQNVLIEGHTDTIGDESYNQELSARRAESVKLALVLRGVETTRVVTRGLGESSPLAANIGELARLSSLRVEIIFEKVKGLQPAQRLSYYQPR